MWWNESLVYIECLYSSWEGEKIQHINKNIRSYSTINTYEIRHMCYVNVWLNTFNYSTVTKVTKKDEKILFWMFMSRIINNIIADNMVYWKKDEVA